MGVNFDIGKLREIMQEGEIGHAAVIIIFFPGVETNWKDEVGKINNCLGKGRELASHPFTFKGGETGILYIGEVVPIKA